MVATHEQRNGGLQWAVHDCICCADLRRLEVGLKQELSKIIPSWVVVSKLMLFPRDIG